MNPGYTLNVKLFGGGAWVGAPLSGGGGEGVLDKSAEPLLKTNKQITSLCPVAVSSEHSRDFGLSLEQMANEHHSIWCCICLYAKD